MKQLTLRGFDDELALRVQEIAEEQHISLNKAVLRLLRIATGLDKMAKPPNRIGDRLDEFIGSWSDEEEKRVNKVTKVFDEIDSDFWP